MQQFTRITTPRASAVVLAACSIAAQAQTESAPSANVPGSGHAQWALVAMAETDCNDSLRDVANSPITLNSPCMRKMSHNLRPANNTDNSETKKKQRNDAAMVRPTPVFSNWFQGLFR